MQISPLISSHSETQTHIITTGTGLNEYCIFYWISLIKWKNEFVSCPVDIKVVFRTKQTAGQPSLFALHFFDQYLDNESSLVSQNWGIQIHVLQATPSIT